MQLSVLTFSIVLFACLWASAHECAKHIPKDGAFDFAHTVLKMKLPDSERHRMFSQACEEFVLGEKSLLKVGRLELQKVKRLERAGHKYVLPFLAQINAIWSELGDSKVEQEYKTKLNELAKIEDPDERIRRVYLLAIQYQGNWVPHNRKGSGILGMKKPADVLKDSEEMGTGGVCRDFSSLLTWSLNEVSRAPVGIARQEFLAEFTYYPGHAIVTVKRFEDPNSRLAKVYSLDPTNYSEFVPIPYPDVDSPEETFRKRYDACIAVRQCVGAPRSPKTMDKER